MRTPLLALAVGLSITACGPRPTPRPERPAPVAEAPEQRLGSGLWWAVEPMPGATSVAVQLWLPAGAATDPAGHPGTAAFSALVAEERLKAALAPIGGRAEGRARVDAIALMISVAPDQLGTALAALAGVVSTPPAAPEVERARTRFAARLVAAAGQPERRAMRRLLSLAWGAHPGARPLMGVDPPPAEAVEVWRAAHMRPGGAALVVAGAVKRKAAREAIAGALDGWTGAPPSVAYKAPTPPAKGPIVQVDPRDDGPAQIRLAWPIATPDPAATAAADALALSLVLGPDAPLPAALSRAGVMATTRALVHAPGPDGLIIVSVDLPAAEVDRAWKALADALTHVARHPPDRSRIARVVDALDAAHARAAADPEARAAEVGPRIMRWPGARGAWRAALGRLEPAGLGAVAGGLRARAMTAWIGTPVSGDIDPALWGEQLAEAFTAERAPTALAGGFPGISAQVVPRPGSGIVAIHLRLPAGATTVPPDLIGAAHLAAAALAEPLPGLGRPTSRLGPDALEVALTVPADRFPMAMAALLDRLLRPDWSPERVEKARTGALTARRLDGLANTARRLLVADLARVGGAPTAEPEAVVAGLETIPPARVAAWFDGFVTHGPIRVTAVGDLDEAALFRALAAGLPAERTAVGMRPLVPAEAPAPGVHRTDRRVDGDRAAWAVGWSTAAISDDALASIEVALSLVALAAVPADSPLTVQLVTESGRGAARVGIVLAGPAAALRAGVERTLRALGERTQIAADADRITAAIRWREGRRRVAFGDPAAFAAWIAEQADAGRSFVGGGALSQWQAALERSRGIETLHAAQTHLPLAGRFEVWIGPGAPPHTPDSPAARAPTPSPDQEAAP